MHIGLNCPELSGHLNPMTTLGRVLVRRGHRVTVVAQPDGRPLIDASLGTLQNRLTCDPGYRARARQRAAEISDLDGVRRAADIVGEAPQAGRPVLAQGDSR